MHVHFLDPYRPRASVIHALDPRVKFVLTVAFILTTSLTPVAAWPVYVLLFALVLAVAVLSELGVAYVLRRAVLALPFVLAALPLIVTAGPPTLAEIGGVAISQPGVERFLSITLKSWISVQMAIILTASTTFPDLLLAMRAVKVPRLLVAIFGLMWRYLFLLVDKAGRLMRARAARSGARRRLVAGWAAASPGAPASPAAWRATCSCVRSSAATASTRRWWPAATTARCAPSRCPGCRLPRWQCWRAGCPAIRAAGAGLFAQVRNKR